MADLRVSIKGREASIALPHEATISELEFYKDIFCSMFDKQIAEAKRNEEKKRNKILAADIANGKSAEEILEISIDELSFSIRALSVLHRYNVDTVEKMVLLDRETLAKMRNMGVKTISEVENKIEEWTEIVADAKRKSNRTVTKNEEAK